LRILGKIKSELKLPILTDIHDASQADLRRKFAMCCRFPRFLARQTDLLIAAAKTGRVINVKKPQFLSPWDMGNVVEKVESAGNKKSFSPSAAPCLDTRSRRGYALVPGPAADRLPSGFLT